MIFWKQIVAQLIAFQNIQKTISRPYFGMISIPFPFKRICLDRQNHQNWPKTLNHKSNQNRFKYFPQNVKSDRRLKNSTLCSIYFQAFCFHSKNLKCVLWPCWSAHSRRDQGAGVWWLRPLGKRGVLEGHRPSNGPSHHPTTCDKSILILLSLLLFCFV